MIASVRGRLLAKQPTRLVVEVGGVGLELLVPLATSRVVGEAGDEVSLRTTLVVREDSLTLYGFATAEERALFLKLIGVSGIGPKMALSALSGSSVADLVAALRAEDVALLTRIPGIGKKTAERMIVELKDAVAGIAPAAPPSREDRAMADAVAALVSLGYSRAPAEKAVQGALKRPGASPELEAVIRLALGTLSGSK